MIDRLIPPHPAHVLSCVGVRWEPGCWVVAVDRAGNQGMDDSDGKFTIQFPMKEAIKDKEVKEHWEGKDGWEKDIWEKDVGISAPSHATPVSARVVGRVLDAFHPPGLAPHDGRERPRSGARSQPP